MTIAPAAAKLNPQKVRARRQELDRDEREF